MGFYTSRYNPNPQIPLSVRLRREREIEHREDDEFPNVAYVRAMKGVAVVPRNPWDRPREEPLPRLVGITGKKRAGKDTFARGLLQRGFQRFAFADPLRESALALDPLIRFEQDEAALATLARVSFWGAPHAHERLSVIVERLGWEKAKEIREVRRTLQRFGRGIRAIDEDFWARPLRAALEDAEAPLVVTDVRFPNEAALIRELGGVLLRIVRPDLESTDTDESETALDGHEVDAEIHNHGAEALTDLAREIRFVL